MNKKHTWALLPLAYIVWWFYAFFTWAVPLIETPLDNYAWAHGNLLLMMMFLSFGIILIFVAGIIMLRILRK